jgi:hypothetical protein
VSMDLHPAATNMMIIASEEQLGARLPKDYVQFLKLANGGEGFIGNAYAIFWSVEELSSMNRSYEVQKYAPGLLIFGSDGGGEAYGFDTRASDWPIVQVPFVGMAWNLARPMGTSFSVSLKRSSEME